MADSAFDKLYAQVASRATGTSGTAKGPNTKGPVDPMAVDTRGVNVQPEGYRKATALEQFMSTLNKAGEGISDVFGFGEKQAASRARIQQEDPNASEAELFIRSTGENILPFLGNLPGMMIGAIPSGISKAYEAITGSPVTEGEDGWIRDYTLDAEQKLAAGLDAAIDLVGVGMGGTGAALRGAKGLVTGGKVAAKTAERTASWLTKEAGKAAARGEADEAVRLAKRAGEIWNPQTKTAGNLTFSETLKEAKMFTTGNTVADLALETAEEGGEEFAQSIFEDVRGDYSGHKSWGDDIDMTKAIESAALGALGGFAMSGTMHGLDYGIRKFDEKFTAKPKVADNETLTTTNFNYAQSTAGLYEIPGVSAEIRDMISKTEKYKSAVLDYGRTSTHVGVDEVRFGLLDFVNLLIKETGASEDSRYVTAFVNDLGLNIQTTDGTNQIVVNGQNFREAVETALNIARYQNNTRMLVDIINGFNASVERFNSENDGFWFITIKNPGGNSGYVRLKFSGIEGVDPQVVVHQMTATVLNSDFDSDMFGAIAYEAVKKGVNGNHIEDADFVDSRTTSELWAQSGANSWTDKNFRNIVGRMRTDDIVDFFLDRGRFADPNNPNAHPRWQRIHDNISHQIDGINMHDFETIVRTIVDIAREETDIDKALENLPQKTDKQKRIRGFIKDNANFWAFLHTIGHKETNHDNTIAVDFFSRLGNPASAQQIINQNAAVTAMGARDTGTENAEVQQDNFQMLFTNEDRMVYTQDAILAPGAKSGINAWSWAKIDLFQAATVSTNRGKCRELLQLYFSLKDVIYEEQLKPGSTATYQDIVHRAVMRNIGLRGPGQNPHDLPIAQIQYYLGVASVAATNEQAASVDSGVQKHSQEWFDLFEKQFKKVHDNIRREYFDAVKADNPNVSDVELNMSFPEISNYNLSHEMLKSLQDVSLSFFIDGFGTSQTLGQYTADIAYKMATNDIHNDRTEDQILAYASNAPLPADMSQENKRAVYKFLSKMIEARIENKARDEKTLEDAVISALNTRSNSSAAFATLRELRARGRGQNAPVQDIDFADRSKFSEHDINAICEYAGWINGIVGKKVFTQFDWITINQMFTETENFKAKIVDKLLSDNYSDVIDAIVSMKFLANTGVLHDTLMKYIEDPNDNNHIDKIAIESAKIAAISPFYDKLIAQILPSHNNTISLDEQSARNAVSILERFYDADVTVSQKREQAVNVFGYTADIRNIGQKRFDTFVSDMFASTFDQEDITTVSSNIRKSQHFIREMAAYSATGLEAAHQNYLTAINAFGQNFDEVMKMVQDEAEALGKRLDLMPWANASYFFDWRPSKSTIDKTAAHTFAESIQKNNAIANGYGYVNDDMDTLNYVSNAPQPIRHIVETPQLFSRMLLTNFIGDKGGMEVLDSKGATLRFENQADFVSMLAGERVQNDNGRVQITEAIFEKIIKNVPEAIYAFMPSTIGFNETMNQELETVSYSAPDYKAEFDRLKKKYENKQLRPAADDKIRNEAQRLILSNEKFISSFWYTFAEKRAGLKSLDETYQALEEHLDNWIDTVVGYQQASDKDAYLSMMYASNRQIMTNELLRELNYSNWDFVKQLESAEDEVEITGDVMPLVQLFKLVITPDSKFREMVGADEPGNIDLERILRDSFKIGPSSRIQPSLLLLNMLGHIDGTQPKLVINNEERIRKFKQLANIAVQQLEDSGVYSGRPKGEALIQKYRNMIDTWAESFFSDKSGVLDEMFYLYDQVDQKRGLEVITNMINNIMSDNALDVSTQEEQAERTEYILCLEDFYSLVFDNASDPISSALHIIDYLKKSYTGVNVKKSRWSEVGPKDLEDKLRGSKDKPAQALSKSEIVRLGHFFIHDTTNIDDSRLDARAVMAHRDSTKDFCEKLSAFIEKNVTGFAKINEPKVKFPAPNMVNAEFASDITDQILRGYIPSLTSAGASSRYLSVTAFYDMAPDLGAISADEVEERFATNNVTTLNEIKRKWDSYYAKDYISKYRNGESVGFYYRRGDQKPHALTVSKLNSIEQQPSDEPIVCFTIFEENAGFDSKYWGWEQQSDQQFNPIKRMLRKLIIGVEAKALKAAKQEGLHIFASYTGDNELAGKNKASDAETLIMEGGNHTLIDICNKVAESKEKLVKTIYDIYTSTDENRSLDITANDLIVWADMIHQHVNVYFKSPITIGGKLVDHIPVSFAAILAARRSGVTQLSQMNEYRVTIDDETRIPLSDIMNMNNAEVDHIQIARTSFEQLNTVMFDDMLKQKAAVSERSGNWSLNGSWSSEFENTVGKIRDGRLLRRIEHLNTQEQLEAFRSDISSARFKLTAPEHSRLLREGRIDYRSPKPGTEVTADQIRIAKEATELVNQARENHTNKSKPFIVNDFTGATKGNEILYAAWNNGASYKNTDAVVANSRSIARLIEYQQTHKDSSVPRVVLIPSDSAEIIGAENVMNKYAFGKWQRNEYYDTEINGKQYRGYYIQVNSRGLYQHTRSGYWYEDARKYVVRVSVKGEIVGDPGVLFTKRGQHYFLEKQNTDSHTIYITKPENGLAKPATRGEILANLQQIRDGIAELEEEQEREAAYSTLRQIQNQPRAIRDFWKDDNHYDKFVNSGAYQCIGFWKVEDGTSTRYVPITVQPNNTGTSGPILDFVDLESTNPKVSYREVYQYSGETGLENSYKGASPVTGVKEMEGTIDPSVHGYWYMNMPENDSRRDDFQIYNSEDSFGKTSGLYKRIWSYWRWMRMMQLSMFSTPAGKFDDSILSEFTYADKKALFSKDENEIRMVYQRLSSGQIHFTNRQRKNDSSFNEAMIELLDSFIKHKAGGSAFYELLSGIDYVFTFDDANQQIKMDRYGQAPALDTFLIWRNISDTKMQTIYHIMAPSQFSAANENPDVSREKGITWNRDGQMLVGHQAPGSDAIEYDYREASIDSSLVDMGKNTDHMTTSDVALGHKIQAMAALSGDMNADLEALRAEQIVYMKNPSFYRGFLFSTDSTNGNGSVLSSRNAITLRKRQPKAKNEFEKRHILERSLSRGQRSGRDIYTSALQLQRSFDEIEYKRPMNPSIRTDKGIEVVNDLSEMFPSYVNSINKHFTKPVDPDWIWEWVKLQLGYLYDVGPASNIDKSVVIQMLEEIDRDLSNYGVPVYVGEHKIGQRTRYKVPVLSRDSMNFVADNLTEQGRRKWRSRGNLESTIVAITNEQIGNIKMSHDRAQKQMLLNMVLAFASEANIDEGINTGITGVDDIDDIIAFQNQFSEMLAGDEFMESIKPVIEASEARILKYQDQMKWSQKAKRIQIDPKDPTSNQYDKFNDMGSYKGVINYLCSSTKMMAMAQPLLAPIQVADRFVYGGMVMHAMLNSIEGSASPYKSNVKMYMGEEKARWVAGRIKELSKSKQLQKLVEERRMINLLAEDGFTTVDIDAAGGLEKFLQTRAETSSKYQRFYNKFMEIQTGKGILSDFQAATYLADLVRLMSVSDMGDFFFKQKSGNPSVDAQGNQVDTTYIETMLSQKDIVQWLYNNAFDPQSPLYELSNQAFNTSMEGDAAKNNVASIWFSEMTKAHPLVKLFTTTTFCRFPMYAFGITDRVMNTVFPMTALNYVLSKVAGSERLKTKTIPGLKGLTFGAIDWSNAQTANSLEEALAVDLQRHGIFMMATILLGISGAVEPPDDEDKWGNIDEWLFFGERVSTKWWFKDLLGPTLSMVATWKSSMLGKPRPDIFLKGMMDCMGSNPIIGAGDAVEMIFDPYGAYMDAYYADVERFSRASDGQPDAATVLWANASTKLMAWSTQFVLPSFFKELLNAASEYETSYKKVYQVDAYGNILYDEYGAPKVVDATYYEQKLRQQTRKNPVLGFIADLITGSGFAGDKTGYLAWEMPRTVYYDTTQMDTYQRLSLYTVDQNGNVIEKSEDEKQAIALEVIYSLMMYNEAELGAMGFAVPYDTLDYVSDIVWDIAYDQKASFEMMSQMGVLDPLIIGDGDYNAGVEIINAISNNSYQMGQFWKDFYYNKLWSDTMKQGLQRYNRYNTTYAVDDNGEIYATGIKKDILSVLAPFQIAPKAGTLGYYEDWSTPSAVTGKSLGQRALLPVDDKFETPSWDSIGSSEDGHSKSYSKTMSSYGYKSGSRYTYTGPNIYAPNAGGYRVPYAPNVNYSYSRPITNVDLQSYYIRPGFETKGSRKAYKREDI